MRRYVWCSSLFTQSGFPYDIVSLQVIMRTRLSLWVGLAVAFLMIMAAVTLFNIPLRSKTLHSHYDLSGERVLQSHDSAVQREAAKLEKTLRARRKSALGKEEQIQILTNTFKKADENGDSILEIGELGKWIAIKTKEHLTLALKENFVIFTAIDKSPRNGVVSWSEYFEYFMKQRGYDGDFIKKLNMSLKGLPRETKESVMRDKASWLEAARDDPNILTIDEFLAFRHPESSHAMILTLVEETLARLDLDEDGMLTEEEFSDPMLNEVPADLTPDQFKEERINEFRSSIDSDASGKVDKRELLKYIDPRNFHHAEKEAINLVSIADKNRDGVLVLQEVLDERDLFMNSKMIDVARSFHDEF